METLNYKSEVKKTLNAYLKRKTKISPAEIENTFATIVNNGQFINFSPELSEKIIKLHSDFLALYEPARQARLKVTATKSLHTKASNKLSIDPTDEKALERQDAASKLLPQVKKDFMEKVDPLIYTLIELNNEIQNFITKYNEANPEKPFGAIELTDAILKDTAIIPYKKGSLVAVNIMPELSYCSNNDENVFEDIIVNGDKNITPVDTTFIDDANNTTTEDNKESHDKKYRDNDIILDESHFRDITDVDTNKNTNPDDKLISNKEDKGLVPDDKLISNKEDKGLVPYDKVTDLTPVNDNKDLISEDKDEIKDLVPSDNSSELTTVDEKDNTGDKEDILVDFDPELNKKDDDKDVIFLDEKNGTIYGVKPGKETIISSEPLSDDEFYNSIYDDSRDFTPEDDDTYYLDKTGEDKNSNDAITDDIDNLDNTDNTDNLDNSDVSNDSNDADEFDFVDDLDDTDESDRTDNSDKDDIVETDDTSDKDSNKELVPLEADDNKPESDTSDNSNDDSNNDSNDTNPVAQTVDNNTNPENNQQPPQSNDNKENNQQNNATQTDKKPETEEKKEDKKPDIQKAAKFSSDVGFVVAVLSCAFMIAGIGLAFFPILAFIGAAVAIFGKTMGDFQYEKQPKVAKEKKEKVKKDKTKNKDKGKDKDISQNKDKNKNNKKDKDNQPIIENFTSDTKNIVSEMTNPNGRNNTKNTNTNEAANSPEQAKVKDALGIIQQTNPDPYSKEHQDALDKLNTAAREILSQKRDISSLSADETKIIDSCMHFAEKYDEYVDSYDKQYEADMTYTATKDKYQKNATAKNNNLMEKALADKTDADSKFESIAKELSESIDDMTTIFGVTVTKNNDANEKTDKSTTTTTKETNASNPETIEEETISQELIEKLHRACSKYYEVLENATKDSAKESEKSPDKLIAECSELVEVATTIFENYKNSKLNEKDSALVQNCLDITINYSSLIVSRDEIKAAKELFDDSKAKHDKKITKKTIDNLNAAIDNKNAKMADYDKIIDLMFSCVKEISGASKAKESEQQKKTPEKKIPPKKKPNLKTEKPKIKVEESPIKTVIKEIKKQYDKILMNGGSNQHDYQEIMISCKKAIEAFGNTKNPTSKEKQIVEVCKNMIALDEKKIGYEKRAMELQDKMKKLEEDAKNGVGLEPTELNSIMDELNTVGANFKSTTEDIVNMLKDLGNLSADYTLEAGNTHSPNKPTNLFKREKSDDEGKQA